MIRIAHGIVCWSKEERQTGRYGKLYFDESAFAEGPAVVATVPWHDAAYVEYFRGKKVRMHCVVIETRDSEHVGDRFLDIKPSRPEVGETIDLGVGIFSVEPSPFPEVKVPLFVLMPEELRARLWIDPRKLYRLHSQTVDLMIEETSEVCTPAPDLSFAAPGRIALGDGSFQGMGISETEMLTPVPPKIEKLGDGIIMSGDWKNGERIIKR